MAKRNKDTNEILSRKYIISWNNYPVNLKLEDLLEKFINKYSVEYCILAFEIGEEKHTPHIQGYIRFTNPQKFSKIRSMLENDDGTLGFIKQSYGTDQQNFEYCSKQGKYVLYERPITNNELSSIFDDIIKGLSYIEICKKHHHYVLYHYRDFKQLYKDVNEELRLEKLNKGTANIQSNDLPF